MDVEGWRCGPILLPHDVEQIAEASLGSQVLRVKERADQDWNEREQAGKSGGST